MSIDYKEIGQRMAKRRKELGLKQYEVCEIIDVNYKYISNLETGRSAPSLEVIMKLCEALQTTPDYLLLGTLSTDKIITDKQLFDKISMLNVKNKMIINDMIDVLCNYQ